MAILLLLSPQTYAQTHGYGFAGVAAGENGLKSVFRYGLGGMWSISGPLTAGIELGAAHRNGTVLVISPNVGAHFRGRQDRGWDPFVTGGLTYVRASRDGAVYWNLGGGTNYWLSPRFGLRAEMRASPFGYDVNRFAEVRFGVSFR